MFFLKSFQRHSGRNSTAATDGRCRRLQLKTMKQLRGITAGASLKWTDTWKCTLEYIYNETERLNVLNSSQHLIHRLRPKRVPLDLESVFHTTLNRIRRKLAQIIWPGLQSCWNMETNVGPQHFGWHLRHWWARPAAPVHKRFKIGFHNKKKNVKTFSVLHVAQWKREPLSFNPTSIHRRGTSWPSFHWQGYLTASDQKCFHILLSRW